MKLSHIVIALLPFLHACVSEWCTPNTPKIDILDGVTPQRTRFSDFFYIAGLFDISKEGNQGKCGKLSLAGLQNSEAFIWAVKTFKSRYTNYNSAIDIGAMVFDTCSSSWSTVQKVVNLEQCTVAYSTYGTAVTPQKTFAYVGPPASYELAEVIAYLQKVQKTAMGMSPASKAFPFSQNFMNMVPNAKKEAEGVMSIVKKVSTEKGWTVFRIIYASEETDYSQNKVYEEFKKLPTTYCFEREGGKDIEFEKDDDATAQKIAQQLEAKKSVRGTILFLSSSQITKLMNAVTQKSLTNTFTWIASTGWTLDGKTAAANEDSTTLGALVLAYPDPPQAYKAFETAFRDQLVNSASTSVKKYIQQEKQCDPAGIPTKYNKACSTTEKYMQDVFIHPYAYFTIKAVDAALFGIEAARSKRCTTTGILCSTFLNSDLLPSDINAGISDLSTNDIKFDKTNNAFYYTKFDYKNKVAKSQTCSSNCFDKVGIFTQNGNEAATESWTKQINYYILNANPTSTCILNECSCKVKVTTGAPKVTSQKIDVTTKSASTAAPTAIPYFQKVRDEVWVIPLMVLASVGILLVIIFEIFFIAKIISLKQLKNVRTMWSGQILLLGVLCSYLLCFAFVVEPNAAVCGIIRFGVGVCYAIMFSILLVKILVILSSKTIGYLKGIFQFLMFIFALAVQIAIDSEWLILIAPAVEKNTCNHTFYQMWVSLVYMMLLIILITLLAIRSHGIVTNHREGIFIGLAAGFSIPIWIAWGLVGSLNSYAFKEPSLVFGLLINATLILFTMFMPKVRQLSAAGLEAIYLEDDEDKEVYGSVVYGASMYNPHDGIPTVYDNVAYAKTEYTTKQLEALGISDTMRTRHVPGPYSVRSVPVHNTVQRTFNLKGNNYKYQTQSEYNTFDRFATKRGSTRSDLGAL